MDLGHISFRASRGHHLVGHASHRRIATRARLVRLWSAVGFRAHDESHAWFPAPVSARMDGLARAKNNAQLAFPRGTRRRDRRGLLRPLDYPQLRNIPSLGSPAIHSWFAAVARQ